MEQTKGRKTLLVALVATLAVFVVYYGGDAIKRRHATSGAITAIANQDYEAAADILWPYRETSSISALYYYSYAMKRYGEESPTSKYESYKSWDMIPDSYRGALFSQILSDKKDAMSQRELWKQRCDAILMETARKSTECRRSAIPGMHVTEDLIDDTIWGKHLAVEPSPGGKTYYFKDGWAFIGKDSGYVEKVHAYTDAERPNTSAQQRSHNFLSADPYEADKYSSADDFYYWHMDDFVSYEEAEAYWEKHCR